MGRDSSIDISTIYGPDGPGSESRWGPRFSAPIQAGPGAHPSSYKMGTGSTPGVKPPGRGVNHPLPSSSEVKERLELYLYPHLDFHGLFLGQTFYLYLQGTACKRSLCYCQYNNTQVLSLYSKQLEFSYTCLYCT